MSGVGQAAVLAASICAKNNVLPKDLEHSKLVPLRPDDFSDSGLGVRATLRTK